MGLWIFQMVFNVIIACVALAWFLERRRTRENVRANFRSAGASRGQSAFVRSEDLNESEPSTSTAMTVSETIRAPAVSVGAGSSLVPATSLMPATQRMETPLGSPVSTLSERRSPETKPVSGAGALDAFEKAEFLMTRGLDLKEVARQTGLSMAELRLIGKMTQKNQ